MTPANPSMIPPRVPTRRPGSSAVAPGLCLQPSSLFQVPLTPFRHRDLQPTTQELNQSHRANICTHVSPDDRQDGPSALGPHTPVLRKQREPGLHPARCREEGWGALLGPPLLDNWPGPGPSDLCSGWDLPFGEQEKYNVRWRERRVIQERGSESPYQRWGQDRRMGREVGTETEERDTSETGTRRHWNSKRETREGRDERTGQRALGGVGEERKWPGANRLCRARSDSRSPQGLSRPPGEASDMLRSNRIQDCPGSREESRSSSRPPGTQGACWPGSPKRQ